MIPRISALHVWGLVTIGLLIATRGIAAPPDAASKEREESTAADELAREVAEKAGDPGEVEKLAFSFIVEVGGDQKVRRRHIWRPEDGRLTVEKDDTIIRFQKLHDHNPTQLAEAPGEHTDAWQSIAPDTEPARAAEAWSWFVNDSYWLLAPAKLFDPGVQRSLDDQGRLVLTFGDVGLTPDDRYRLTIDRDPDVVTRWQFELQDGRSGAFRWRDYQRFGPLYLSTRRVSESESPQTVIKFDDIEVSD